MYPFLRVFGRTIGTYGVLMVLGVVLVCLGSLRRGKARGLQRDAILIVGATTLGFALLGGGTLYNVVTYSWTELWERIRTGDLMFFLNGGLVYYGGLLGGVLGAILGTALAGAAIRDVEWTVVPLLPLGHAIGRWGCVFAGCCYGVPYEGLFSLHYPHLEGGRFPVQLLEGGINLCLSLWLLRRAERERETFALLTDYLGAYALVRFLVEYLRGDSIRGIFWQVSLSQWVSLAILAGCGLFQIAKRK